jgi:hypothetical protein
MNFPRFNLPSPAASKILQRSNHVTIELWTGLDGSLNGSFDIRGTFNPPKLSDDDDESAVPEPPGEPIDVAADARELLSEFLRLKGQGK